jgi:hypothetical protein
MIEEKEVKYVLLLAAGMVLTGVILMAIYFAK